MGYTEILPGIARCWSHLYSAILRSRADTALACDSAVSALCCFTSTETLRLIRDGHLDFHTAPELCECVILLVGWVLLYVHRNRRLIRDREPRTATSTFTQLKTSASVILHEWLAFSSVFLSFHRSGVLSTLTSKMGELVSRWGY